MATRGATGQFKCDCGKMFTARLADRKRGWGRSCSKSCAAIKSNRETGKYQKYLSKIDSGKVTTRSPDMLVMLARLENRNRISIIHQSDDEVDDFDPSWDAHKEQF